MKYEKSHPWISFKLNLDKAGQLFWIKMGETASKCKHLAGAPLRPDVAENLNKVFLAKGALATAAIEGNTLSEEQALRQVEGELKLPPSQEYLQQEVQNIIDVCNEEVQAQINKSEDDRNLCRQLIEHYNNQVLNKLDVDEDVIPGKFRMHGVAVGTVYRGAPPEDCEYLIDRYCKWLNSSDFVTNEPDLKIPFALLKAIVAHVYFAWIHPFGDGNGRTARLIEFHILFSSGVPLPAAHLLSDHYNRTRSQYYRELDRASKSGGDLIPFIQYAIQGFLDGLRNQIEQVQEHQMDVMWENYIHEKFREKKSSLTQKRRRDLILELSKHGPVAVLDIENLSPAIAKAYAKAGNKMLQRDLNAIKEMGLISRHYGSVVPRKFLIQGLLPAKIENNPETK